MQNVPFRPLWLQSPLPLHRLLDTISRINQETPPYEMPNWEALGRAWREFLTPPASPQTPPAANPNPNLSPTPDANAGNNDIFKLEDLRRQYEELQTTNQEYQKEIDRMMKAWEEEERRVEQIRSQYQQFLEQRRRELDEVLSRVPQKAPISKPEAIAVAIATLFNPQAGGAAAAGVLAAREARYQDEMKRYEMITRNAMQKYQIETQQAIQELRNLIDFSQTNVQRRMGLIQTLFNQIGMNEQRQNQLLRLLMQHEIQYERLQLEKEKLDLMKEIHEDKMFIDVWNRVQNLQLRRQALAQKMWNFLASGAAAAMTPEQIQAVLSANFGELSEIWESPAMRPIYEALQRTAQTRTVYYTARANLMNHELLMAETFDPILNRLKIQNLESQIRARDLQMRLAQVRTDLARQRLEDFRQGRVPISAIANLASTVMLMGMYANQILPELDETARESYIQTHWALAMLLDQAMHNMNIPSAFTPLVMPPQQGGAAGTGTGVGAGPWGRATGPAPQGAPNTQPPRSGQGGAARQGGSTTQPHTTPRQSATTNQPRFSRPDTRGGGVGN